MVASLAIYASIPSFRAASRVCLPMQAAVTFRKSSSGAAWANPCTVEALVNTAKSISPSSTFFLWSMTSCRG